MATSELNSLDAIIKRRTGGAHNIRGIRYQILYSIHRSLQLLLGSGAQSVRLEGAEDFDYVSLESGNFYIQVKTSRSAKPWSFSKLRDPLHSFLEIHRVNPDAQFTLAVDFVPKNDVQRLFDRQMLGDNQRSFIDEKFHREMQKVGASRQESEGVLNQLGFEIVPEDSLKQELLKVVSNKRGIGLDRAAIHIGALVNEFLIWSENRTIITKHDLDLLFDQTERVIAQSNPEYDAFKQHLLDEAHWSTDDAHYDFFDGKATRPDHIGANLDVRRPKWMKQINDILDSPKSRICILRASSGQGKSTLMYRYAHDYWNHGYVLLINLIATKQDATDIKYYLRQRAKLGNPYLVLIDGIDSSTKHWFEVAQECTSLGFPMIATVRHDDWFQYGSEHVVAYEPLEPSLSLDEARAIYGSLQEAGTLADDAPLAEVAFEQVGKPPLLIEYVFLITQGKMLEERIRDQLRSIGHLRDAAAKKEVLRRVSLAHTLGAPLDMLAGISGIQFETDPNDAFSSLINEYIRVDNRQASGIHWVRSYHLSRILHETLNDEHRTILRILQSNAVPRERLSRFITNALTRSGIEVGQLMSGLVRWAKVQPLNQLIEVIEGVFGAGERNFLEDCRPLLDVAQSRSWGLREIATGDLAPRADLNTMSKMAEIIGGLGTEMAKLAKKLPELRSKTRGIHLVQAFLIELFNAPYLADFEKNISKDISAFGQLLRWCTMAETRAQHLESAAKHLIQQDALLFDLPLDDFTEFAHGVFLYAPELYNDWYDRRQKEILTYLRLHLDCIRIDVYGRELTVEYLVDHLGEVSPNDQSMRRLYVLRSALPFCQTYCSRGIWILPYQLSSSIDDSVKNIDVAKLPPRSDVRLNVVWDEMVRFAYSTDSIFSFQEAWHNARSIVLQYVRRLVQALRRRGQAVLPSELLANQANGSLLEIMLEQLRRLPPAPQQISQSAKHAFHTPLAMEASGSRFAGVDAQKWCQSLQNFGSAARRYTNTVDDQTGRLIVTNFMDAYDALSSLHEAFAEMFRTSPDYFHAERLKFDEKKEYEALAQVLEAVIFYPPSSPQKDLLRYARARIEEDAKSRLTTLSATLTTHLPPETAIGLPHDVIRRGLQVIVPFTFSVKNPCNMNPERDAIQAALTECSAIANQFWMIPMYQGYRLIDAGFVLFRRQLNLLANHQDIEWEFYVPQRLDPTTFDLFPQTSVRNPIEYQMRQHYEQILMSFDMLKRAEQLIAPFAESTNHFDQVLADKHAERLQALRNEIRRMVNSLIADVESSFPDPNDDKNYILNTLQTILSETESTGMRVLRVGIDLDMKTHNEIATRLFCSTFD